MRFRTVAVLSVLLLAASGCDSDKEAPGAAPSAVPSAGASAALAPPLPPPVEGKAVSFRTSDGVTLAGDVYVPEDRTAPAVVLAHAFRADRSEWAPLTKKLASGRKRFTVLSFDLRGHGASKSSGKGKKHALDWSTMGKKDVPELVEDVRAAARQAVEAADGRSRGVVLVGSSLSAAIVAKAAPLIPKVTGLALVSPGAAIQGFDLYRPFAAVRHLPAFLGASETDNVSREPLDALTKMAKRGTVKRYPGGAHSARWIGKQHPELWDDLVSWLESIYDEKPAESGPPGVAASASPGTAEGK